MANILLMVLAAGAVGPSAGSSSALHDSPRAQFERQFIGIDEYSVSGGDDFFVAYQGKYKHPLDGAEFYEAVGRPDLAANYRSRSALKTTLEVAAPLAGLFGVLYAFGVFSSCSSFDDSCGQTRAYVGIGILGGGLVMDWIAMSMNPAPISRSEARALVDEYNDRLRQRLQFKPAEVARPPLVAAIVPLRGGAGAALAWTF